MKRRRFRRPRHFCYLSMSHTLDSIMHTSVHYVRVHILFPHSLFLSLSLSLLSSLASRFLPPSLAPGIDPFGRRGSSIGQRSFPQPGRPMCERLLGQYRKSIFVVPGCHPPPSNSNAMHSDRSRKGRGRRRGGMLLQRGKRGDLAVQSIASSTVRWSQSVQLNGRPSVCNTVQCSRPSHMKPAR